MAKPPKPPTPETMNERILELHARVEVLERWKGTPFLRVLFATIAVFCLAPLASLFWYWLLFIVLFPALLAGL